MAGDSDTIGGLRRQVRPLTASAGAASVFNQISSIIPFSWRPSASLPIRIGPTPGAILPAPVALATSAPST